MQRCNKCDIYYFDKFALCPICKGFLSKEILEKDKEIIDRLECL